MSLLWIDLCLSTPNLLAHLSDINYAQREVSYHSPLVVRLVVRSTSTDPMEI